MLIYFNIFVFVFLFPNTIVQVIPVTAPELVFDPIMSCIAEGCSLLVGEKRTKIFALRTGSGVIDWVLDNGKVMSADLDKELKVIICKLLRLCSQETRVLVEKTRREFSLACIHLLLTFRCIFF